MPESLEEKVSHVKKLKQVFNVGTGVALTYLRGVETFEETRRYTGQGKNAFETASIVKHEVGRLNVALLTKVYDEFLEWADDSLIEKIYDCEAALSEIFEKSAILDFDLLSYTPHLWSTHVFPSNEVQRETLFPDGKVLDTIPDEFEDIQYNLEADIDQILRSGLVKGNNKAVVSDEKRSFDVYGASQREVYEALHIEQNVRKTIENKLQFHALNEEDIAGTARKTLAVKSALNGGFETYARERLKKGAQNYLFQAILNISGGEYQGAEMLLRPLLGDKVVERLRREGTTRKLANQRRIALQATLPTYLSEDVDEEQAVENAKIRLKRRMDKLDEAVRQLVQVNAFSDLIEQKKKELETGRVKYNALQREDAYVLRSLKNLDLDDFLPGNQSADLLYN